MLKKIRVYDLQVGMYVVDTGLSWIDHPYLFAQEGLIESEEQLRDVRAQGFADVFVETDKDAACSVRIYDRTEVDRALSAALNEEQASMRGNKAVPLATEMEPARLAHRKALQALSYAMEAVATGVPMDPGPCMDAAREIAASVTRNRDALICLSRVFDQGRYHLRHGVGVAVLAAAFGEYLGLNRSQVTDLTLAGLMHDVGKALTPRDLLDKPGKLTDEEYARLKRHPIESCAVVSACMTLPEHVLRGIAEHHERHDGSGYPRGLKQGEQCFHGRLLAVCDVFDALTQDRPYRARQLPDRAMSVMFAQRGRDFEPVLLERFVKCLGIYPAGSLVRLNSGEFAAVSQSNPDTPLRPKVIIVFDQDMHPIHPVPMDLSGRDGPAPARPLEVVEVVDHRPHGFRVGDHLI